MKSIHSKKAIILTAAVCCLSLLGFRLNATTYVWTNSIAGSWNTPELWTPNGVPGATDTAIITNVAAGVYLSGATAAGAIILGNNSGGGSQLTLNGQTLTLYGPLTVNSGGVFGMDSGTLAGSPNAVLGGPGLISWDGASMAGVLTLAAGSTMNIVSGADHNMPACTFTNNGSVVWTGGRIRGGGTPGTLIQNNGLWNVQLDNVINNDFGGAGTTFNNAGTFSKSVTTGDTVLYGGVFFNQTGGSCDVQGGRVLLQSGGSFTGGTATNTGTLVLNGGGFLINGTLTTTNVQINGGTLTAGSSVIKGGLNWVVGQWNNGGPMTIATNSLLLITSGNDHDLFNCVFTNLGTVAWSAGRIRGGADPFGTQIYNYGLFDVQNDGYTVNNDGGGSEGTTLNNYGTFRKSVGTNTSNTAIYGGAVFNQLAGVLDTQNGVLVLASGGNFTGGFTTTNGTGTTYLNAGGFNINGTVTSSNVVENAGNLVGTNNIRGALQWQAGTWDNAGPVTLTAGSTLFINNTADHDLANCIFTNNGMVIWISGRIRGGGNPSGTQIDNNGLFDVQNDGYGINNDFGGVGTTFNNFGTFRKSVGNNANNTPIYGGVLFNQLGDLLDVQSGNLSLQSSGNFTGGKATNTVGMLILNGGGFFINGTITSTNVQINGGTLAAGNNVVNGGLNWVVGSWNNAGAMTIAPGSLLLVTSANDHDLENCTFTNNGTVMWLAGRLRGGGTPGTPIYNNGLFDVQCDSSLNDDFGGTGTTFNNAGTVRKELTSGVTAFTGGVTFNNTGTMDMQNGNLALQGAYTLANGTKMGFGLGGWLGNGSISLLGPAAFNGSVSVNLNGYFYPSVGNSFNLLNYTSETGVLFTNTVLPPQFTWQSNYNATAYAITVVTRPAITNTASTNIYSHVINGTTLYLAWPGDHTGWSLQAQTNSLSVGLTTNWTTVAGSTVTNEFFMPINTTNNSVFFRMIYP